MNKFLTRLPHLRMNCLRSLAAVVFSALLSACSEERATAEVGINQLHPLELYETCLPNPVGQDPVALLLSDQVVGLVAAAHDYRSVWQLNEDEVVKKLRSSTQANFDETRGVLKISSSAASFDLACQITNSFAEIFCEIVKEVDQKKRKKLLETLDVILMVESDLVQDFRKDRTVLVQQYGSRCFGKLEDAASERENFAAAKAELVHFNILEDHRLFLEGRLRSLKKVLKTEPSDLLQSLAQELASVEDKIARMTEPVRKSGPEPVDEVLIKLSFQQADRDYENHWNILNRLRAEQELVRHLLKIPFEPATALQRAR